jgi:hypothetical protein
VWLNKGNQLRAKRYKAKYKHKYGLDADAYALAFVPRVAMLAGEGKKNGRLFIGDGSVNPSTISSLTELCKSRRSSNPGIDKRPHPSVVLMEEIRVRCFLGQLHLETFLQHL